MICKNYLKLWLTVVLSIFASTLFAQSQPFKFSVINYGIYTSMQVATEQMNESPTGKHSVVDKERLLKQTDKIPAVKGTQFGAEYKLTGNAKDSVILEVEWIFPSTMIDSETKQSYKSVRYPLNVPCDLMNGSSYTLENDYEVLKGEWILNIYYENKVLYSRKFFLK